MLTQENQFILFNNKPIFNLNTNSWVGNTQKERNTPPVTFYEIVNATNPANNKIVQLMQILILEYTLKDFPKNWQYFKIIEFYPNIQTLLMPDNCITAIALIGDIIFDEITLTKSMCENPNILPQMIKYNITDIDVFFNASELEKRIYAYTHHAPLAIVRQIIKICKKYQYRLSVYLDLYNEIMDLRKELGINDCSAPRTPNKTLRLLQQQRTQQQEASVEQRIRWLKTIDMDGYSFTATSTRYGLNEMGRRMSNCIGNYYDNQISRDQLIIIGTEKITGVDFAFTVTTYLENAKSVLLKGNNQPPERYKIVANTINKLYQEFMKTLI